ncbi:Hca operon transcriptional activator HcaR [compost metagenome]
MLEGSDYFSPSTMRLLLLVAQTGNLTEAARVCGISQPAASKAIARAEAQSGIALVRRDRRPLSLTAEGLILADYAQRQGDLALAARRAIEESRVQGRGLVRIASFGASASTHILPGLVAAVTRRRPLLRVEISESADQISLQALRDGLADFAIAVQSDAPDLEMISLARDRLVALVRLGDPLALAGKVDAATLSQREFILTKGGSEPLVRAWFARTGHEPSVRHNIQQITSILAMVRAGMGVSVIAEMAVPDTHAGVAVVPLAPEQPRVICLARRQGSFASHAAELLWNTAADRSKACS